MSERDQAARGGLVVLAACGALLVGCGNGGSATCSGASCPSVDGQYLFTLSAPLTCTRWQAATLGSSYMAVQQADGKVTVTLFSTEHHPHYLAGTLASGGTAIVNESQQLQVLGLPIASMTGSFLPVQGSGAPFRFRGTLTLIPTAPPPTAGGAGTPGATTAGGPLGVTPTGTAAPAEPGAIGSAAPVTAGAPAAGAPEDDTAACSASVLVDAEQVTTLAPIATTNAGTTTGSSGSTGVGTTGTTASGLR